MNQIEIASLKDKILLYLSKHSGQYIDIGIMQKDLQLSNFSQSILNGYVKEMEIEGVIKSAFTKGGGCIMISDEGEKFLSEGGYSEVVTKHEQDRSLLQEKTKLEIQNLKRTKWISIIAIIVSILSLIISIINH